MTGVQEYGRMRVMKKVVFIGGGSGLQDIIPVFLQMKCELTAIVSVFDSGGSTGQLRQKLNIPAVGDLRRVYSAASQPAMAELMEYRESIHPVGNLALAFFIQKYGFAKGLQKYAELTQAKATVVPISFDVADVIAVLENGQELLGEHQLDAPPKKYAKQKVTELKLNKKVQLNPAVKKALRAADVMVTGPGSLLGSLLPNFLVPDFATSFEKSKATKIFVAPGRPEFGYRGEDALEMAERLPVSFDEILENPGKRWEAKQLAAEIKKLIK